MKKIIALLILGINICWAIPKPMESIEHYNVIMMHGALGSDQGFDADKTLPEATKETSYRGKGHIGKYDSENRLTYWLSKNVFEESDSKRNVHDSYLYSWRSFTNPANSSKNNAIELGDRTWNKDGSFGKRRALVEEAQEVKATLRVSKNGIDSVYVGQAALDTIRKNPDLYRKLASRYILIGHSMGGVVSREYVQNSTYYHGDVDKIITLDSPHEGTGALNMQLAMQFHNGDNVASLIGEGIGNWVPLSAGFAVAAAIASKEMVASQLALRGFIASFGLGALNYVAGGLIELALENYHDDDPLVHYVDPNYTGENINVLKTKENNPDSLPMFRLLAMDHSMTFTDPDKGFRSGLSIFIPDAISVPIANVAYQLGSDNSFSTNYTNAMTGLFLGFLGGINVQGTGSSLVETDIGLAKHTKMLTHPEVDVRRSTQNAALYASDDVYEAVLIAELVAIAGMEAANFIIYYPLQVALKVGIPMAAGLAIATTFPEAVIAGIMDLINSHNLSMDTQFRAWMLNDSVHVYEDFLYEKPFVNLALNDIHTLDMLSIMNKENRDTSTLNRDCYYIDSKEDKECAVGLFGSADDLKSTQKKQSLSSLIPLRFKSEMDWSKMGVKVDRWEMVDGLDANGKKDKLVPIRHVERYVVPDIEVKGFIEKYSFVVDDLMPHRLRQLKINFNYKEEIAWECDPSKSETSDKACVVYKRSGSGDWDSLWTERHPVKKNGRFEFEPRKYKYDVLSTIQKDNQNTVTISTTNKIGLSNTQRFYYLFKATENMLKPIWPKRDLVLNKIENFQSYASALGYQGYRVNGAKDEIQPKFSGESTYTEKEMAMTIDAYKDVSRIGQAGVDSTGLVYDSSSAYFVSKHKNVTPKEGKYLWVFSADLKNMNDSDGSDSTNTYEVPFQVDRTAPKFILNAENSMINPDSSDFAAWFKWDGDSIQDIRVLRLSLEHANISGNNITFSKVAEFKPFTDVASPKFAIQWDEATRNAINDYGDGLYRIKAYAVDYAVPDTQTYNKMNELVFAIENNPDSIDESLWPSSTDNLNVATQYVEFVVDKVVPKIKNEKIYAVSTVTSSNGKFTCPQRDGNYAYATYDSLTNIEYQVHETVTVSDSVVPVTISWNFVRTDDLTKVDHSGDSVWVGKSGVATANWMELAEMRLEDGDYEIQAHISDVAGNDSLYKFSKKLRVDKTAPNIESLVSTQLVYPDSVTSYSATVVVNEKNDVTSNRTGMYCYYQVSGSGKTTPWKQIPSDAFKKDSAKFEMESITGMRGKCYLEVDCIDAAGNVALKTDLFYIGERTPVITSPDTKTSQSLVAITGIAPPSKVADSLNTIYRLRYAKVDTTGSNKPLVWETSKVNVVSAICNDTINYVSKVAQSEDGVLGYINRNLGNDKYLEGTYLIELATCAGSSCLKGADSLWKADTVRVLFEDIQDTLFGDTLKWNFATDRDSIRVGRDSLIVTLNLSGNFNGDYFMRVYAKDAKNVGMFDEAAAKVIKNPYYGEPKDTVTDSSAVWFYELDGKYHLVWHGLATGDTLQVSYNSSGFGKTCVAMDTTKSMDKCDIKNVSTQMLPIENQYVNDYPEIMPPLGTDREMNLTAKEGHIVMSATEAFRISRKNAFIDSTLPAMRVYFANSDVDGYYWLNDGKLDGSSFNPLAMGWTVDPKAYGIKFKWSGFPETGAYPAEGKMKIYAEVTENVISNPHVYLDTIEVDIKLDPVKIALAKTLPDFTLLKKDSVNICKSSSEDASEESCETKLLLLKTMVAKYGIKNREAAVRIYVIKDSDTVAVIPRDTSVTLRANASDSAYQVQWDGKRNNGTAELSNGKYELMIVATPSDGSKADTARAHFNVNYAETLYDQTPNYPKNENNTVPSIHIAEALYDNAVQAYRYEPVADYLVDAEIGGWKMPNPSLANGIPLSGTISGEQSVIGYEPMRFDLAIKRHRKELQLMLVTRFRAVLDEINGWYLTACSENGSHDEPDEINAYYLAFDSTTRTSTVKFEKAYSDRGFDGRNGPSGGILDMVVLTIPQYYRLLQYIVSHNITNSKDRFKLYKDESIWSWSKYTGSSDGYHIPGGETSGMTVEYPDPTEGLGCNVEYDAEGRLEKTCTYDTDSYDPDKKIFKITFSPLAGEKRYYHNYGKLNSHCDKDKHKRYKNLTINMKFEIPLEYWNADFGMDNLMNRTVRFDHTNITIFGDDGYWKALEKEGLTGDASYHDGNEWKFDKTYGLLTPFETQKLHYYPSNEYEGGANTFLFPDEEKTSSQASRFDMRFYGPSNQNDYFVAKVLGAPDGWAKPSECDYDPLTNISIAVGDQSFCQIQHTSLTNAVTHTPYFAAYAGVDFYVGRNTLYSTVNHREVIPFPIGLNWKNSIKGSVCKEKNQTWTFVNNGKAACYKYYDYGSRVHYYYGDYTDAEWSAKSLRTDGYIKNWTNAPYDVFRNPQSVLFANSFIPAKIGNNKLELTVSPSSKDYDQLNHRFFIKLDTIQKLKIPYASDLVIDVNKLSAGVPDTTISISTAKDYLYIAADYFTEDTIYRKGDDAMAKPLARPKGEKLPMSRIYNATSGWIKNAVINSAKLMHLDSSEHSHLDVIGTYPSNADLDVEFKPDNVITVKRPKELVEMRAYLKKGIKYQLAYLNGNAFYTVPKSMLDSMWRDEIKSDSSDWYRLGWFDVNKLQGNTQFLLMWGDDNGTANIFSKFEMVIGREVKPTSSNTVKSLFEEASVTFPSNSVTENKDITVRTVDAKDYPFEVFNNLALKGPIVEVLPSMTFENSAALPRVQMKISSDELKAMNATPQTVKLYKVDSKNKKFVPLENALYGYLDKSGRPLVGTSEEPTCSTATDKKCYTDKKEWAYLLISAETHTFSVFTALDSAIAETPNFSVTILPEIASSTTRNVRVDGISRFALYVDDDSLWADRDDVTPPVALTFTADTNGLAKVTLPTRGNAVDTSYVFVVALGEPNASGISEELPAAPVAARALTVNTEFVCTVPADSLWLGLDNGYMAYGASCTHPGYGLVSLYRGDRVAAEIRGQIPDTIFYDGFKTSGNSRVGKLAPGVYESRYIGVSALGMDIQLAGPRVHTDSARPVIRNFDVQDTSDVLDRIFTVSADVYDSESGIARVAVTPVYGGDTLRVVSVLPDSAGHVTAKVRLTRKQLAECTGCYIAMDVRVEDYGHNHAEKRFVSEKLYPYPTELALWYPAREDMGTTTREFLGTGHDLNLKNMKSPWRSDAGLYFGKWTDYATGIGRVDFGSTGSYSFEARVKNGYAEGLDWRRILGFRGAANLDISLELRGRSLRLVEGNHVWGSGAVMPSEKTWAHVVVTVDSAYVKFYVDGELKATRKSGISQERELEGVFSMGKLNDLSSYIGNVADIRMYSRALTAAEVEELSKPITDAGEVSDVIVVAVKDMDIVSGFTNDFSCSVAGNKYLTSGDSAVATMPVFVQDAAEYNVVLYVRAAASKNVTVSVGESSLQSGTATVSNVWRAVTVSGVTLDLSAGTHTLTLKVPEGLQIGGLALTTANIPASMIAWGVSTSDKVTGVAQADTARKIKSYLRYEGYPETSTLRPRIRLQNVSGQQIEGFSVRYYFRGEDASQASVERYWPNDVATFPAVHSESANTGYVEWKFTETQIPVNGTVFSGDGPHFGLYNADYIPWDASDDPSYVDPALNTAVDGFYEDMGIVILDNDNNLIGGSCAEMEDPISLEAKARVLASDSRGNDQASEIHVKVENTGSASLKNFDVRYYFYVEEGFAPVLDINHLSDCSSATMESLGSGRWQVDVRCDKPLAPGKAWRDPVNFTIHMAGWANMWNVGDDPSHDSLGTSINEARGICVFDSAGNMIYGKAPTWLLPAPDEVDPDSVYNVDFGYRAPDNSVPVIRTPDGLVITLDNWTYLSLDLVTAVGTPVKSLFNGTLAPGEQLVNVDWTGIDMNKTYLVLRVNGNIKSTKKLSLM